MTLVTMTIPSADLLTLFSAPVEIVAAPGPGKILVVRNSWFRFHAGSTPYENRFGSYPLLQWGSTPFALADRDAAGGAFLNSASDGLPAAQGPNNQLMVSNTQDVATNLPGPVNAGLYLGSYLDLAGAGPMTGVSLSSGASTGPVPYVPGDQARIGYAAYYGGASVSITTLDATPGVNAGDFPFTLVSGGTITVAGDRTGNFIPTYFARIYPADSGKNGQGQIASATYIALNTIVVLDDPNGTLGTVPATGNIALKATPVTGITIGVPGDHMVVYPAFYTTWINPQPGVGYDANGLRVNVTSVNYTPPADMGSVTLYVEYEVLDA